MMKYFFLFFIVVLSFGSCYFEPKCLIFDRDTFDVERQLWQRQDIRDYSFRISVFSSGIVWDGIVVVRDGILYGFTSSKTSAITRLIEPSSEGRRWIGPMDSIFDSILMKIESKFEDGKPDAYINVTAKYNNIFHFPEEFYFASHPVAVIRSPGDSHLYEFTISDFTLNPEIKNDVMLFNREQFDLERALWRKQDIRSYSFAFSCNYNDQELWQGTRIVKNDTGGEYWSGDKWGTSISGIFDAIVVDTLMKPSLEWGKETKTSLELEFDPEYHFPSYYRYYAEEIVPADIIGRKLFLELRINDFIIIQ